MVEEEKLYAIGESFHIQFVWQVPEGDYLRSIFTAEVLNRDPSSEKYMLKLTEFVAGRQENPEGEMRPQEEVSRHYWQMVSELAGRTVIVAYEAGDGRPLHLRFATLTGEHNFFYRFDIPEKPETEEA